MILAYYKKLYPTINVFREATGEYIVSGAVPCRIFRLGEVGDINTVYYTGPICAGPQDRVPSDSLKDAVSKAVDYQTNPTYR